MRTVFVSLVLASLVLAACGPTAAGTPVATIPVATQTARVVEVVVTATHEPTQATEDQAETPEPATETAAPAVNTPTPTPTLAGPQLRTAEDIRSLGKVTGWVTGGASGEFIAGAQLELKRDTPLLDILQDGVVYEFQCVHYLALNGEVHAKPVCESGLVRFSTGSVLPKGAIGTLWLPWAVKGDPNESWDEGFLNAPCLCPDGDCRDE
jgi:hypothetical protein